MRKHFTYVIIRILIFETPILHGLATYPEEMILTVTRSKKSFFKPKRLMSFESKRWMSFEAKRWMSFEAKRILALKFRGKLIQIKCLGMSRYHLGRMNSVWTGEKWKIMQHWNSVIVFKPIHYSIGNWIQVLKIFK